MKLKDAIGFDPKSGRFTIGTHDLTGKPLGNDMQASAAQWQGDVQHILSELSTLSAEDHLALAAAIVEPIEKVVPYVEMYNVFYQDVNYGDLEDNAIPVEDTVTIAWETHQDGAARPVRSGFSWTRPEFTTYDTAIELPWAMARKAGWNFYPHAPTDRIKCAGPPAQVGWHQTRGSVRNSSDIDILNKRDLYLIEDQEHAYFIGNDISLWEIRITA